MLGRLNTGRVEGGSEAGNELEGYRPRTELVSRFRLRIRNLGTCWIGDSQYRGIEA